MKGLFSKVMIAALLISAVPSTTKASFRPSGWVAAGAALACAANWLFFAKVNAPERKAQQQIFSDICNLQSMQSSISRQEKLAVEAGSHSEKIQPLADAYNQSLEQAAVNLDAKYDKDAEESDKTAKVMMSSYKANVAIEQEGTRLAIERDTLNNSKKEKAMFCWGLTSSVATMATMFYGFCWFVKTLNLKR